jgi:hypothetical protein
MTIAPALEAATKTKRTKDGSYLSLRRDDGWDRLHLRLAGLLWRLWDPPPSSTVRTTRAGTTTGAGASAEAGATAGGGPNASAGASSIPIGGVVIHLHSTLEGGTGGSDTILANR